MDNLEWHEYIRICNKDKIEAETSKTVCTMCGKLYTSREMSVEAGRYDAFVGHPSFRGYERIQFDLYVDCFSEILGTIIPLYMSNARDDDGGNIDLKW